MKKKSTSQTARTLSRHAIVIAISTLALCASPTIALAADCVGVTSWTDHTGSWFVAGNWLNNQPPTVAIGAEINNMGTAQVNGPGAVACDLTVGYNPTDCGTVSVNGGSLTVGHEVEIGGHGKGTLILTNGGSVNNSAGFLTIAALGGTYSLAQSASMGQTRLSQPPGST